MIDCLAVDAVSGEALGMLASLVIAAVLVLVGWGGLPWLGSPRSRATGPDALGGRAGNGGQTQPAIVNLVLTNCVPGAGAYQGTILDLAARGFLAVSNDPGHLGVALAQPPVAPAGRARRARLHSPDRRDRVLVRPGLAGAPGPADRRGLGPGRPVEARAGGSCRGGSGVGRRFPRVATAACFCGGRWHPPGRSPAPRGGGGSALPPGGSEGGLACHPTLPGPP